MNPSLFIEFSTLFIPYIAFSYIGYYLKNIKPEVNKIFKETEKLTEIEKSNIFYDDLKEILANYTFNKETITDQIFKYLNDSELKQKCLTLKEKFVKNYPFNELKPIIDTFYEYMPVYSAMLGEEKLKTLSLNKGQKDGSLLYRTLGSFNPKKNTIYLNKRKAGVLEHEFLHAISTTHKGQCYFVGFTNQSKYTILFEGLNEGFTELLNERIFGQTKTYYAINKRICRCLELLFDEPKKIEAAYFLNDIEFLFKEFLKYGTKDEFAYLNYLLDVSTFCDDYQNELNDLMLDLAKRTNNENKITEVKNILNIKENKKLVKQNY